MIEGVQRKIFRVIDTIRVTDNSTLLRLDNEVQESGFKEFCEASPKTITAAYPGKKIIESEASMKWGKWKDKIEYWLESIETTLELYSELAGGSALKDVLEILRKAVTALAKAISSTK